jgi:hypothetical protein
MLVSSPEPTQVELPGRKVIHPFFGGMTDAFIQRNSKQRSAAFNCRAGAPKILGNFIDGHARK